MVVAATVSGCFNSQTWDFNSGRPFTDIEMKKIENELKKDWCRRNFNFTVGEPLEPENLQTVKDIAALTKDYGKDVALWTGYYLEDLNDAQLEALKNVDYCIDGPFIEELKDISLRWRGSGNQKVWKKINGVWAEEK